MALKEISLAQVLEKTSGTAYFSAFVQLVGKTSELVLYEGITEEKKYLIEELESQLDTIISSNYLEFLKITNGGRVAGMNLFSLDEDTNVDSLYYRNFKTDIRKKIKLPSDVLIIGEYDGGIICFEGEEDDEGSFILMDVYNKEKLEFAFFEDLITFRFYFRLLEGGKKKIEEEKQRKLAAKKLHESIAKKNKERKQATEKAIKSIGRKASLAGLKRMKK